MEFIKKYLSLDSTMNEAKRYVLSDFNEELWDTEKPILFQAQTQTNGRGQYGKVWASPAGAGLYLSLLSSLRIPEENFAAYEATQIVLDSLKRRLRECSYKDFNMFSIKPINDIYWNGKKLAGILIERFTHNEKNFNVVGIGLNLFKSAYKVKEGNVSAAKAEPVALEEICGKEKTELFAKKIIESLYSDFEKKYFS